MTRHGRHTPVIRSLPNKRRLAKMAAFVAAAGLVTTAGVVTRGFYRADNAKPISAITSFSATDSAASRSAVRGAINSADKDTSFVTVKINGDSRVALGEKGVMETTSLVKRAGGAVVSSNVFTSWVKKAPVDKVILVGTGSGSTAASDSQSGGLGTTVPAGEIQSWAHQYLLDNGYSEGDFTAANYIISHESGWSPTATNPSSGTYGLARTDRPTTGPSSNGSSATANSVMQHRRGVQLLGRAQELLKPSTSTRHVMCEVLSSLL